MKRMKKIVSILLAAVMALGMSMTVFATEYGTQNQSHTITIENTDQNVTHTYEAYQIFVGNLDAAEEKLSDIRWGSGVDAAGLIEDLQTTEDSKLAGVKAAVKDVDTSDEAALAAAAETVAQAIAGFDSTVDVTVSAGEIDAFASIVANNLRTRAAEFEEVKDNSGKGTGSYTAGVTGDGYYFIKDVTTSLTGEDGSDTVSKYLLSVVKNTTIVAKDTGLTPDKKIVDGENRVKEGTAAIGDEVTFEVKVDVPNTKKYEDHFVFIMNDQLPKGLTFMEVKSIVIGATTLPEANYTVTAKTDTDEAYKKYDKPANAKEAIEKEGGQAIKIVFNDFKNFVETNNLIQTGNQVVITYTAVVNDDATYGATGNENEVYFDFSNNPNHDYTGDEFKPDGTDPRGETPKSKTTTYVTALEIFKYTGERTPLAGAEFEVEGTAYNMTLVTGQEYVEDQDGEYYKLKDGSYTKTAPGSTVNGAVVNETQYESTTTKYRLDTVEKVLTEPVEMKITVISDENGLINIKGLKPGTYTVRETKAPDGYNKIDTELQLVISWDRDKINEGKGGFSIGTGTTGEWTLNDDGSLYQTEILNNSGAILPSTGGIGTTIFYVAGSILVLAAVVLLVAKKRMSAEK